LWLGNVLRAAVLVVVPVLREAVLVVLLARREVARVVGNVPREAVRVVVVVVVVTGVGSVRPMPQPQPPKLPLQPLRKRVDVLCLPVWPVLRVKSVVLKRRPTTLPPLPRDPRLSWFVMSP